MFWSQNDYMNEKILLDCVLKNRVFLKSDSIKNPKLLPFKGKGEFWNKIATKISTGGKICNPNEISQKYRNLKKEYFKHKYGNKFFRHEEIFEAILFGNNDQIILGTLDCLTEKIQNLHKDFLTKMQTREATLTTELEILKEKLQIDKELLELQKCFPNNNT